MTLDEIEERVKQSLEALNSAEEIYDWRLTFYNTPAWANLEEGCYFLSEEKIAEVTLKELIKTFRDRSQTSYIDFHIKVPEPGVDEFRRMAILFGPLQTEVRLIPPRDADARKAYLQEKTISAMRLSMENKLVISEKIRQQFNWLMIREKEKSPSLLAVSLNFESYNAYHKKLASAPTVTIVQHRGLLEPIAAPAPAPMFAPSAVDNSGFESRLAPTQVKRSIRTMGRPARVRNEMPIAPTGSTHYCDIEQPEAPHELPSEIHEEFATYCQNLYEKAKGN